jgi:hypothetical protein
MVNRAARGGTPPDTCRKGGYESRVSRLSGSADQGVGAQATCGEDRDVDRRLFLPPESLPGRTDCRRPHPRYDSLSSINLLTGPTLYGCRFSVKSR